LDGFGNAGRFADYLQWESWQGAQETKNSKSTEPTAAPTSTKSTPPVKRKLSYLEAREYATLENRLLEAERTLEEKRAALADPAIASNATQLLTVSAEVDEAKKLVDQLYARWAELEEKQVGGV
jgi:ATP-binding cassette subfamily F protein uup